MARRGVTREAARPEEWFELGPHERLSRHIDYADIVPNYEQWVAQEGEAEVQETLDYFFYLVITSEALLTEREFADWRWPLDPHDYLVYELNSYVSSVAGESAESLDAALTGPLVHHMVHDGLHRYYTPTMRRALARRARNLARRQAGRVVGAQADCVALAAEDPSMDPMTIGLLVQSFRRALLQSAAHLADAVEREWAQHNRTLDRYLDEIRAADHAHPADAAVRRLAQAGPEALPLAQRLAFFEEWDCDDYPFRAALQVAAEVPSHQALWLLRSALSECPTLREWLTEQMVARMPELACAYFCYLLSAPRPAPADLAANGLWVLAQARCPEALALATHALHYRQHDAAETEKVQVAAWQALLALDDPAAVPALRSYLADETAHPAARDELVRALQMRGEGWWTAVLQPEGQPSLV